ncbi:MAG: DUF4258 domain-containing protein [Desulfobacterales bacterium]
MTISVYKSQSSDNLPLTNHAMRRMSTRNLSFEAVYSTLQYGRVVYARGAAIHAIGRKEVHRYKKIGINLSAYEGVQVLCNPKDGTVITVYRNRKFRRLRF